MSSIVYKDQCSMCFSLPEHQGGILVCVAHNISFCANHIQQHLNVGCKEFLQLEKKKILLDATLVDESVSINIIWTGIGWGEDLSAMCCSKKFIVLMLKTTKNFIEFSTSLCKKAFFHIFACLQGVVPLQCLACYFRLDVKFSLSYCQIHSDPLPKKLAFLLIS